MQNDYERKRQFEQRVEEAKRRAHGRWTEVLAALGVSERILNGKNQPCPGCGGVDRFQYTDKFGQGNYHCRHCGPGGGFKLLQAVTRLGFGECLRMVEQQVGALPAMPEIAPPKKKDMRKLLQSIWDEAAPLTPSNLGGRYLAGRGIQLEVYPRVLRLHNSLPYYEREGRKKVLLGHFPCLIARVDDVTGRPVTIHRIYLDPELDPSSMGKAKVREPKKALTGMKSAAIHLHRPAEELALAEGIETALAVHLISGLPVWSTINAGNMEEILLPESVRKVYIYGDNDPSFRGQLAAYRLAYRLSVKEKRQVTVVLRSSTGDWLDVLLARQKRVA